MEDEIVCPDCDRLVNPMPFCPHCGGKTNVPLDDIIRFMNKVASGWQMMDREGFIEVLVENNEYLWAKPTDPCDDGCRTFEVIHDAICGSPIRKGDIVEAVSENDPIVTRLYRMTGKVRNGRA